MSESSPHVPKGATSEGKILIVVLLVGVLAAIGFRYQLHASKPTGDPEFIRKKVADEDMPPMEGNMPSAPPI